MEYPARPFIGRLLAEIARIEGGVPAAAEAMGVDPRVLHDLTYDGLASPRDLQAVYTWLAQRRVALTALEAEDFQNLWAASNRAVAGLERVERPGGVPAQAPRRRHLPTLPQVVAGLVILVLAVALSVLATTALVRVNSGTAAEGATSAPAGTSAPPPSPSPSTTQSGNVPGTPSPSVSFRAPARPHAPVFRSNDISISNAGSGGPKDLSADPPVTTTDPAKGDVTMAVTGNSTSVTMIAGNGVTSNGVTIGVWQGTAAPTHAQCQENAQAAGVGQVQISLGQTVCVKTSSGAVARLKLTSISQDIESADFSGTIWYPPGALTGG